jgi:hypothetical protein
MEKIGHKTHQDRDEISQERQDFLTERLNVTL